MLASLASRWFAEAETLATWGDGRGAEILRRCACELETEAQAQADEALTIEQAADESGYSRDHLRSLVASGSIPNAGRRGSPRIRRKDLPMKPGAKAAS